MNAPQSLGALFLQSCDRWPERTAIILAGDKGARTNISYAHLEARVAKYASHLMATGIQRGDKLCILSENRLEWALTDWACHTLGITVVPIYTTLPADQTQFIASDSGARVVVVSDEAQAAKVNALPGVRVLSFAELESLQGGGFQEAAWREAAREVSINEIATIIYTSGTTGNPKGAVLPNRTFLSLTTSIRASLPVDENDVFLSFLPLSHVYERFAGHVLPISIGAAIAYSRGATQLGSEMMEIKPTIMLTVPRLLESIRLRIMDSMSKQSGLKKWLFKCALSQGMKRVRGEFAPFAGILDKLVGTKIRERTGGRLKFFVSGGAALSPAVSEFFMAFRLTVLQGYGLTETMAASCVNHPDRNRPETVGEPISGVELKIAPDGEILIRGPSVMDGYYNLPEATAEAIDSEGWFHSGDIGEIQDGRLKITDRKKDLIVLANGKNVAPQPIENRLKESGWISEAVLFGDGMDSMCGLIVPNYDRIKVWARDHGLSAHTEHDLAESKEVQSLIKKEVDAVNKAVADFERVKRYELLDHPFSIEGGELTPSHKVKRKVVRERYQEMIERMCR